MVNIRAENLVIGGLTALLTGCASPREEPAPVRTPVFEREIPERPQERIQGVQTEPVLTRNIQAGPISDHADAGRTCTALAEKVGGTWTGVWNTIRPGEMSVCEILQGRDPRLAGTVYDRAQQPPKPLFTPEPPYSEAAQDKGIEGRILVSFVVTQSGDVRDVKIKRGLEPGLDQSVIDTVKTWQFVPARDSGRIVSVRATRPFDFKIERMFEDGIERVFFEPARFELTASQKADLDKAAAHILATNASAHIMGHTNITGTRADNLALAARRAASVKAYLVQRGVAAEQLETISMGEERPVVAGTGPKADAQNDRVEIKLIKAPAQG